ncbi:MAG: thermostable hemolysin delta-VPH [Clostridia bacterium]
MYYNYHAKIKNLIRDGHLAEYKFLDEYNGIKPVMLLFFDNHRPMPIRKHRFEEYLALIEKYKNE